MRFTAIYASAIATAQAVNKMKIIEHEPSQLVQRNMQATVSDGGICPTMIPPSPLPPDDSTCWQWWTPPSDGVLPPGALKPPSGCDYQPCENAVCACDDYCCNGAWDLSCRGYFVDAADGIENNYFVPGCSAKLLCCEPESAYPDPPIGGAMPPNAVPAPFIIPSIETSNQCNPGSPGCCDTMIPPSYLPPDDSTCWQWWDPPADGVMSSGTASPVKGCNYKPCQDAVCACDSYCCNTAWDLSCRGYEGAQGDATENNYFVDNCSAKILCCEPESAYPDPPVGGAIGGATVPVPAPFSTVPDTSYSCAPGSPGCCETLIPPSYFPPADSTCWLWWTPPADGIMTADTPSPTKGCDYSPCQDAVCACDSYCCDTAWDESCRGYEGAQGDSSENNYFVDKCSAKMLCCEDEITVPIPQITPVGSPTFVLPIPSEVTIPVSVTFPIKVPVSVNFPIQVPQPTGSVIIEVPVPAPVTPVIIPVPVPVLVAPKVIEVPVPTPATPVIIPVPVPVPVAPKIIEVPVPTPVTPVIIPVPVPVPVAPKLIEIPVAGAITPVIIPVPLPVPVPNVKYIPLPVPAPVPIVKQVPLPVPVPVPIVKYIPLPVPAPVPIVKQVPLPVPVPVPNVKYIPLPVPAPVPIVKQVPLPVPVPVPNVKYIPVQVPVPVAAKIITVPVPVPVPVPVKYVPVPMPTQTIIKKVLVPVPVPVPQVKVVPLPVPVPVPTPVVYVPVAVPVPGSASTNVGINVDSNNIKVQGAKEPKPSTVTINIPVSKTTIIKKKNKSQIKNICDCPALPEASSASSVTYISSTDTSKSKSGKSKSGKSGKSGSRRLSSKSTKSTNAYTVGKTSTINNAIGYYVLSEECTCPCFCPSQMSAQNVFVSSETSGKSKSGKSGKAGRRLSSSKCSGKSKGSDSGCSETATITTVSTLSTYNNACICNNVGTSAVTHNTVYASTSASGKSKAGKSGRRIRRE